VSDSLLVDAGFVGFVDGGIVGGGLVVSGLGSISQMRNKIITIDRIFFEKVIKHVSYENQVVRALLRS
jgi:hypothetical protein